jgi:hypothetical protein
MYCATCGNSINENLNYCNVCGAKIGKGELQIRQVSSPIHSVAVALFGMFGLFGFIRLLQILLTSRLDQAAVLTVLIVYLITLFLLCSALVGRIGKRSSETKTDSNQMPEDYAPPKQFRAGSTNQLEAPREPFIGSVTENTTRTFDKVPRPNKS